MEESRVQSILDWPLPVNVAEVRAFLGFINWYRRFIFQFSRVLLPITNILRTK